MRPDGRLSLHISAHRGEITSSFRYVDNIVWGVAGDDNEPLSLADRVGALPGAFELGEVAQGGFGDVAKRMVGEKSHV